MPCSVLFSVPLLLIHLLNIEFGYLRKLMVIDQDASNIKHIPRFLKVIRYIGIVSGFSIFFISTYVPKVSYHFYVFTNFFFENCWIN